MRIGVVAAEFTYMNALADDLRPLNTATLYCARSKISRNKTRLHRIRGMGRRARGVLFAS